MATVAATVAATVLPWRVTVNRCLQYVGFEIFRHFNMASVLSIDDRTLTRWLQMIESHYHTTVSFHNSTHAADVLQASAFFCEQPCIMVRLISCNAAIIEIGIYYSTLVKL